MAKKLLTVRKEKWVKQFKPQYIKGPVIAYNAAVQDRYAKSLDALVAKMIAETEKEIKRLFKKEAAKEYFAEDASVSAQAKMLANALQKKFESLFNLKAPELASGMVNATESASEVALKGSLKELSGGLTLSTDILTGPLKEIVKASVAENVALIKSISSNYLGKVNAAVLRSITTGNGLQDLVPFLAKQKDITLRHARNMALDQTRKTYSHINASRLQQLGVKEFEWIHSGGGQRPRKLHKAMNGKIYEFANPPIIDEKTGQRGLPADAINCKCSMRPIVSFSSKD